MRRVSIVLFCECIIIFLLSVPFVAIAKDITIVPAIAFKAGYDDNVLYSRTIDISDYVGIISPALKLDYASEVFNLRGSGLVDVLRYAQEKDLDYERQYINSVVIIVLQRGGNLMAILHTVKIQHSRRNS